MCKDTVTNDLNEALELIRKIEDVAIQVRNRSCVCLADMDAEGQAMCISYLTVFSKLIIDLVDRGTAYDIRATSFQKRVQKDLLSCENTILSVCQGSFPKQSV